MSTFKFSFLAAALACAGAMAQDRPPRVGETADPPREPPAVTRKHVEPIRKGEPAPGKSAEPAPKAEAAPEKGAPADKPDPHKANPTGDERKKTPLKRRAVHANIESMRRPTPSYGPVLHPPLPTPMPPQPLPTAPPPVTIGSCTGASCLDTNGVRYNGGVGTTLLSPSGRLCNNNGGTISCF